MDHIVSVFFKVYFGCLAIKLSDILVVIIAATHILTSYLDTIIYLGYYEVFCYGKDSFIMTSAKLKFPYLMFVLWF